jgi:hypothetical protein
MPTVDLRFVVHNRKDIDLATKSLVAFNKVSVHRQSNYDAEAAAAKRGMTATERLIRLEDKLIKQRLRDNLVGEARTQQIQAHERILQQEIRTLQDYIDTDKVLEKEQKAAIRTEANLAKQREKTKNDTEKLRMTYDSTYAATKRYKQGLKDIDRAFEGMEDGPERASRAIKALKADYDAFIAASRSGQIVDAGNQFARYGDQAYRAQQRTKRFFSVGMQQAGYQINDFIVQVASGQNALVAFGQQASQLAGIFGTMGALAGAFIAAASAIGNIIYQSYAAREGIKSFEDALSDLRDATEDYRETNEDLNLQDLKEQYGNFADSVLATKDAYLELKRAAAGFEAGATLKSLRDDLEASFMGVLVPTELISNLATVYGTFFGPIMQGLAAPVKPIGAAMKREQTQQTILKGQEQLFPGKEANEAYTVVKKLQENIINAEIFGRYEDYKRVVDSVNEIVALQDKLGVSRLEMTQAQRDNLTNLIEVKDELADQMAILDGSAKLEESRARSQEASEEALADARKKALKVREDMLRRLAAIQKKADAEEAKHKSSMAKALEKAANEYRQVLEREEKAIANSEVQLEQQRTKLELQQAELEYGKGSSQYDKQRVISAKALARIAAEQKFIADGITDAEQEQIELLVEAAGEAETLSQALEDSKNNARDLEASLSSSVSALNSLISLGDSIDKAVAIAEIRLGTLQITDDPKMAQIAATIEGYRQDITKFYEKAFEGLSAGTPEFQQLLDERFEANQKLYALEGYLELIEEENDRIKGLNKSGGKDKKSPGLIMTEELFAMKQKLDLQEASLGKSEEEILFEKNKSQLLSKITDQMVGMSEVDKAFYIQQAEGAARYITNIQEQIKLMQEHEQHQKNVADTIANSMGDALTSIVDGTKSVSDAFKDMARAIIAELYQIYVVKQITGMISSAIAPHVPALPVPAANGNAFSNGNVVPYADGGVVGGPVYFPMNDGRTGLMGEAGPEAIMPLKRGKNGKLGVQADGGSGDVIIHQNFNFTANGDESVNQIIAQQAPAIANMTKKQIMDDRRRGGQMKQAFG